MAFTSAALVGYADDAVVHCVSERQARHVLAAIAERMEQVGLRLHPAKTKIVYCKDANRPLEYEHTSFTFLGFTFRPARRAAQRRQDLPGVCACDQQRRAQQAQR